MKKKHSSVMGSFVSSIFGSKLINLARNNQIRKSNPTGLFMIGRFYLYDVDAYGIPFGSVIGSSARA